MVDPLSVVASALGILTAVRGTLKGAGKVTDYRKAPREIESLTSEVDSLHGFLQATHACLSTNPSVTYSENLIASVQSILRTIKSMHGTSSSASSLQSLVTSDKSRLSWFFEKQKLIALRDDLRAKKLDLVLQLSLSGTYVRKFLRINKNTPIFFKFEADEQI